MASNCAWSIWPFASAFSATAICCSARACAFDGEKLNMLDALPAPADPPPLKWLTRTFTVCPSIRHGARCMSSPLALVEERRRGRRPCARSGIDSVAGLSSVSPLGSSWTASKTGASGEPVSRVSGDIEMATGASSAPGGIVSVTSPTASNAPAGPTVCVTVRERSTSGCTRPSKRTVSEPRATMPPGFSTSSGSSPTGPSAGTTNSSREPSATSGAIGCPPRRRVALPAPKPCPVTTTRSERFAGSGLTDVIATPFATGAAEAVAQPVAASTRTSAKRAQAATGDTEFALATSNGKAGIAVVMVMPSLSPCVSFPPRRGGPSLSVAGSPADRGPPTAAPAPSAPRGPTP